MVAGINKDGGLSRLGNWFKTSVTAKVGKYLVYAGGVGTGVLSSFQTFLSCSSPAEIATPWGLLVVTSLLIASSLGLRNLTKNVTSVKTEALPNDVIATQWDTVLAPEDEGSSIGLTSSDRIGTQDIVEAFDITRGGHVIGEDGTEVQLPGEEEDILFSVREQEDTWRLPRNFGEWAVLPNDDVVRAVALPQEGFTQAFADKDGSTVCEEGETRADPYSNFKLELLMNSRTQLGRLYNSIGDKRLRGDIWNNSKDTESLIKYLEIRVNIAPEEERQMLLQILSLLK